MSRCPSELALEAHLLDPAGAGLETHLAACAGCRARLEQMRREGEEFRLHVYPRTVEAVEEAVRDDRAPLRRLLGWLVPVGGLAAAAAVALLATPRPPSDYLGVKGAPLSLQAWVGDPDGARELADGARVPAAAALRFRVVTARPCLLWIVSVDATGTVSRLYPSEGDAARLEAGSRTIPGGVLLDGVPGPERLYAVCSPEPVPLSEVEAAARPVASGGPESVRRTPALAGLPPGTSQATLLVEKGP